MRMMQRFHRLAVLLCALVAPFAVSSLVAANRFQAGSSPSRPVKSAALSAQDVARQVQDRDTGRDSRAEMRMRLFDRQGRVRERVMTLLTLRGTAGDRTLVRFTYPNDIKGTALLVWEHPAGEDERFLFLPALGRVRRIAGQEKQESFAGS